MAEGAREGAEPPALAAGAPNSPVQQYGNLPQTTGSAVLYHPELKVFKRPESYPIRGVDLSWWNGAIPFERLADTHEIRFAYLKATEGAEKNDPAFDEFLKGARSAGILTGAYHFFNFCDSPQSQFENISKTATGEMDLPIAIAVEWLDGPPDPKQRDCARDPGAVKSNLRQLLEDVTARYKKVPIIYAPPSALGTLIDASFNNYPIWLADYRKVEGVRKPTMRGSNPWTIWQFTDHATLPGIDKTVDLNVFFGNEEQFSRFVKGEGNIGLSAAEKVQ
jgi:lysozyme